MQHSALVRSIECVTPLSLADKAISTSGRRQPATTPTKDNHEASRRGADPVEEGVTAAQQEEPHVDVWGDIGGGGEEQLHETGPYEFVCTASSRNSPERPQVAMTKVSEACKWRTSSSTLVTYLLE